MIWIRSQDKNVLIETNYVKIGNYTHLFACKCADKDVYIGDYSTKEKALKVLDMIQNYIRKMAIDQTVAHLVQRVPLECIEFKESNYVFQMPQDDEV